MKFNYRHLLVEPIADKSQYNHYEAIVAIIQPKPTLHSSFSGFQGGDVYVY
jgi:hypothetical protein